MFLIMHGTHLLQTLTRHAPSRPVVEEAEAVGAHEQRHSHVQYLTSATIPNRYRNFTSIVDNQAVLLFR